MAIGDPREEKLPRWARQELEFARNAALLAERRLQAHKESVEPTRIWYGSYNNKIYVPEPHSFQTIHLNPYGDDQMHHDIQVRIKDHAVEINGGYSLSLEMNASNLFYVRTIK